MRQPSALCSAVSSSIVFFAALTEVACVAPETELDGGVLDVGTHDASTTQDAATGTDAGIVTGNLKVDDTSVLVWLDLTQLIFATNPWNQADVRVTYLDAAASTEVVAYALGQCVTRNGLSLVRMVGQRGPRDMGSVVELDAVGLAAPLQLPEDGGDYHQVYAGTAGDLGPWQLQSWMDLNAPQATPATSHADAVYSPGANVTTRCGLVGISTSRGRWEVYSSSSRDDACSNVRGKSSP